jgi:hypothetical protein
MSIFNESTLPHPPTTAFFFKKRYKGKIGDPPLFLFFSLSSQLRSADFAGNASGPKCQTICKQRVAN